MKLSFSPEVEAFRAEFLTWLADNRPSPEEMEADPALSSAHAPEWARTWTRRMFDAGWLVPGWPPERGGRNAGPVETLVYMEELTHNDVPRTTNPQGLGIIAPSILDYGTPEQIERYAMPVLRGERTACLGMSEPGAGSDLASLSTRAVLDGDHFVVNGQKVWTSGANYAEFCFLFCRTDPDAPKHKGISILLVDMDTPGITVRPLPEIVDPEHPDLNEVFFDDVLVPAANLVGELNNGWRMANGSLAHERSMVWLHSVMQLESQLERLLEDVPALIGDLPPMEQGVALDQVMRVYTDVVAARCLGYRGFAKYVKGGDAPEQALMKAFASETQQRMGLYASEIQGGRGIDMLGGIGIESDTSWLEVYFHSFASTISAGSSEIQRNIISEKVLGLPRS
ncbi:MAG: acyl-CoA dehydrogenase family protein [Acidimicrobiia bacterium]